MVTISVVIPTYNRERFIGEAIRCVLRQTRSPVEIIVCDDGSRDGTEQAVSSIVSSVPIRYLHQGHEGPAAARNLGVSAAVGEWIAFLDDDDDWHPEKLALQEDCLNRHPEAVLLYTHFELIDKNGRSMPLPRKLDELGLTTFGGNPYALPSAMLIKKEVLLEVGGFDVRLTHAEDLDLFARIAERFPTYCLAQKLVKRRYHRGQISGDPSLISESWPIFHGKMEELWRNNPRGRKVLFRRTAHVYSRLGKQYLIRGDYQLAQMNCRKALTYHLWCWRAIKCLGLIWMPVVREWYRQRKIRQRGSVE